MQFIKSAIPEVILVIPNILGDERGFFLESYKKSLFMANGISEEFIQDNHSESSFGVLRGLHYQLNPRAQGKLVRCCRGKIFDVAVDMRKNSPTFGKWVGYELSAENKHMLYIPAGFAHGFVTLSDKAELLYKTTNEYSAKDDRGVLWNDPTIAINWQKITNPILSVKDQNQPLLMDAETNFIY